MPLGEILGPDGCYCSWVSAVLVVNQSIQVPPWSRFCFSWRLWKNRRKLPAPLLCQGWGMSLRGTPDLKASPSDPSYMLTECARLMTCHLGGWHANLGASTNIGGTSGPQSQDCVSFGALETIPLSVLPRDNSWAHLLHSCSWSFSWTSPFHPTSLLSEK